MVSLLPQNPLWDKVESFYILEGLTIGAQSMKITIIFTYTALRTPSPLCHGRYNVCIVDTMPPPPHDGWYSISTREAILDNCFTKIVFCGPSCFPKWLHHFLTLSTARKAIGIAEKEGSLPVYDTDILNTFLPAAEITAWFTGKTTRVREWRRNQHSSFIR